MSSRENESSSLDVEGSADGLELEEMYRAPGSYLKDSVGDREDTSGHFVDKKEPVSMWLLLRRTLQVIAGCRKQALALLLFTVFVSSGVGIIVDSVFFSAEVGFVSIVDFVRRFTLDALVAGAFLVLMGNSVLSKRITFVQAMKRCLGCSGRLFFVFFVAAVVFVVLFLGFLLGLYELKSMADDVMPQLPVFTGLIAIISFLWLFYAPVIYLLARWIGVLPMITMENERLWKAMSRSEILTRGYRASLWGFQLLWYYIFVIASMVLEVICLAVADGLSGPDAYVAGLGIIVLSTAVGHVGLLFFAAMLTAVYSELNVRSQ